MGDARSLLGLLHYPSMLSHNSPLMTNISQPCLDYNNLVTIQPLEKSTCELESAMAARLAAPSSLHSCIGTTAPTQTPDTTDQPLALTL